MDQVPSRQPASPDAAPPFSATDHTTSEMLLNKRAHAQAVRAATARAVSGRRRFVDPTTCEREYNEAELEFMQAIQDYKKSSGRMFPTWSEVLEVFTKLGYEKPSSTMLVSQTG